jgi:hypothetical protein
VNDYVLVSNSPNLNPSGSFSIDAWIFPKSFVGTQGIVAKWGDMGGGAGQRSYNLNINLFGQDSVFFAISDAAHQSDANFHKFTTSPNVLTLNAWNEPCSSGL